MADTSKLKLIDPESARWERLADSLAREFAPQIHPCKDCKYPVVSGYRCTYCGNSK